MQPAPTEVIAPGVVIRPGTPADLNSIIDLIRGLAEYERLAHAVELQPESFARQLFDERAAEVVLVCEGAKTHGFALYFHNFSTFRGRRGLYLEDLFVWPAARGRGFGKALMIYLARLARMRDCARFEWSVLNWNTPSIEFYRALGAEAMDEWSVYRVHGEALSKLAAQSSPVGP
jgi:GNAT superfamily N-acetyltransferase